jgi:predicted RNase H-like HicB family nuclease
MTVRKRKFTASVWREGKWFVAQCLEVDVVSQGRTEKAALKNLAEGIELHFTPPLAKLTPRLRPVEFELSAA